MYNKNTVRKKIYIKNMTGKCCIYPFDYDSLIMLAWSDYYLGKTKQAKVLFEKALMNRPSDKSATDGLNLTN